MSGSSSIKCNETKLNLFKKGSNIVSCSFSEPTKFNGMNTIKNNNIPSSNFGIFFDSHFRKIAKNTGKISNNPSFLTNDDNAIKINDK